MTTKPNASGFVIIVASIAAIAGILFGFDTGVISGAILFIKNDFHLTSATNGLIVSAVLIGALLGSAISGHFADILGRRKLLFNTALIFLVGTLGSVFANSLFSLFISRLIVGFAIGIASFTAPLYISEISPPHFRGALVSLNQLAITIGILLAYFVDAYYANHQAWRSMFAMGIIPAAILLIGMFYLPRSPRWLMLKGYVEDAEKTLLRIRKDAFQKQELLDIQESIQPKKSWKMLTQKWLRPAIFIGLGMAFFQQCTGINTVIYYAPTIFQMAGFHNAVTAILATMGVGFVNVAFTIIALPLIDKLGRRTLLLTGLIGMTISLLILSLAFHSGAHHSLKWIALASFVTYIASFAISLGPIMWLLFAEVFPLEIRGLGSSLAASASWAFNGLVALVFLTLIKHLGASGTFLLFSGISVLGFIFVFQYIPETKDTTLEQIENNLRAGLPSRELGSS